MIGLSILLAVVIYVWLARFATKRIENRAAKYTVIALFILIPTWDIILGKLYFNHLCATQAGVKVYKTVELPAEYWDAQGRAKFYVGWDSHLGKKYPLLYKRGTYPSVFYIDNAGYKFVDRQSGQVLGEVVDFRYWGGWIARNFSPHNTATTCELSGNLINEIFKPSK
jgi:hypothetical protein